MKAYIARGFALAVVGLAVTACQSTNGGPLAALNVTKQDADDAIEQEQQKISTSQLRAFCPRVRLREGTSNFSTYAKGEQQGRDSVVYQASITEVTRSCQHGSETLGLNVAAAGRVIPGPKGKSGSINMPIRVAVVHGTEVLYSELHRHKVQVSPSGATQFLFNDTNVVIPTPQDRSVVVYVGYDEGPYDTP